MMKTKIFESKIWSATQEMILLSKNMPTKI